VLNRSAKPRRSEAKSPSPQAAWLSEQLFQSGRGGGARAAKHREARTTRTADWSLGEGNPSTGHGARSMPGAWALLGAGQCTAHHARWRLRVGLAFVIICARVNAVIPQ
jgi:hypothetical protein